ncbi:Vacuole morphology and inheritance protein 14 [Spathaspora sp. JA1]|nr:Vacuole morphology and inheritance protein 14 [Spathaspora sp. JA1]
MSSEGRILDSSLIKDLSNHIYEKRKATAFQIETLTKAALSRNDSQTIYRIINELTELTNSGTNSAKMGAITALGSVSVALGSFAIAYFLEEIIKPIFATFRDTDARVRYYACESLYNIAKIARGEILLYFNEVFDILCILVTDSESSVKNAADILDRLIKDIVSAKSTNYVSILQQDQDQQNEIKSHLVDAQGVAIQVNNPQDPQKAFSLPKFIPSLLERMYIIDPFAKKFLLSWIELFDDIPSLELISFLPNILEPLIKFLFNNSPSDVRLETENLLNVLLKEIKSIAKVKYQVKKKQIEQIEQRKNEEGGESGEIKDEVDSEEKIKGVQPEQQSAAGEDQKEQAEEKQKEEAVEEEEDEDASIKSSDTTVIRTTPDKPEPITPEGEVFRVGQDIFIDHTKIIHILLSFLRSFENETKNEFTNEPHEIYCQIQFIALKWLREILDISPIGILKLFPNVLSIVMKNIAITDSERDFELRDSFLNFNLALQEFLNNFNYQKSDERIVLGITQELSDFNEVQLPITINGIIKQFLNSTNELSRITSLQWLIFIYSRTPQEFLEVFVTSSNNFDLTDLLKYSNDSSNDVIFKVLQLLAKISETNQEFFKSFIIKLIKLFEQESHEKSTHRVKVDFIIRKLCVNLNSEIIFTTLSEVLTSTYDDLEFLNMMIVTLNNILLTAPELLLFRKKLKNLDVYKLEDWQLFATLFQSWCHNAPSALSLCLLTSNYELAFLIIKNLSESEVTFQLLTQLDVLIQLLESPIFLKLRLQLLEPEKHPYLYKTLYGLLMIIPQSTTYTTLRNRLTTVSSLTHVATPNISSTGPPTVLSTPVTTPGANVVSTSGTITSQLSIKRKRIYEMLDKFTKVQDKHEEYTSTNTTKSRYNDYESSIVAVNSIK